MTMTTITRGAALVASRLVALFAGCICVACAGAILFEDVVMRGASIELNHLLTAGILSIALLAGHLRGDAWRECRRWAAAGFLTLFVAATALVVYLSTGKQAEHTFQSQAEADFAAEERARIKPLLAIEQDRKRKTQDKLQADCVEGRKGKGHCDGLRTTLAVYTMAVKGYEADLAKYGIQRPVAPEAESFANIAAVFGFDKAKVKAGAILVVPFIRTILFELGGLWCLGFAFRPISRTERKSGNPAIQAIETVAVSPADQSDFRGDIADHPALLKADKPGKRGNWGGGSCIGQPKRPNGGGKSGNPDKPTPSGGLTVIAGGNRKSSRQEFEADVLTRLALGKSIDRQDAFAHDHGVHPGTVSKWMKDMRERGLIPASQRVGRCHRLVPA